MVPPSGAIQKAKQILLHSAGHYTLRADKGAVLVKAPSDAIIFGSSRVHNFEKHVTAAASPKTLWCTELAPGIVETLQDLVTAVATFDEVDMEDVKMLFDIHFVLTTLHDTKSAMCF